MRKFLKNRKALIATSLCLILFITGAFAFMTAESGTIRNMFTVGSVGAELREVFNGEELIGGNSQVTEIQCVPNAEYQKETYVKFTGQGNAFAYIKIEIPLIETTQVVDENGVLTNQTENAVNINVSDEVGIGRLSTWYYLTDRQGIRNEEEGTITYMFYYQYLLNDENRETLTSPIDSISIANLLIKDNKIADEKIAEHYDVTVTAYTLQCNDTSKFPAQVWRESGLKV